jgi:hypothetical protein
MAKGEQPLFVPDPKNDIVMRGRIYGVAFNDCGPRISGAQSLPSLGVGIVIVVFIPINSITSPVDNPPYRNGQ